MTKWECMIFQLSALKIQFLVEKTFNRSFTGFFTIRNNESRMEKSYNRK